MIRFVYILILSLCLTGCASLSSLLMDQDSDKTIVENNVAMDQDSDQTIVEDNVEMGSFTGVVQIFEYGSSLLR